MPWRIEKTRLATAFATGLSAMVMAYGPAIAASPKLDESWRQCTAGNGDVGIGACTAIIQASGESVANRAAAYYNRGIAYRRQGQYDRAQPDFDRTILLNKNYGNALITRSLGLSEAQPLQRGS